MTQHSVETEPGPWFTAVEGFSPPAPGDHPRLLFRKSDLPALRKKMQTPEGRAILKRLCYLLEGTRGATLTTLFSDATHACVGGGHKDTTLKKPGVFTIGHVAGYGLLYQLTGDGKYAELGRQCFEKSLAGTRDSDDRYSFRRPGGPLRAGPSLGWHAVGFDLCYDGWDSATCEQFGRAIAEYAEPSSCDRENTTSTLEALVGGTMTPPSNHFGMQVGGAALALLAVRGEAWVDGYRIWRLLKISEDSMIRNLRDGFGDGGFFQEGDGAGSMSSQIAFLSALQAWKTAAGQDFMGSSRPNARMIALKWIYHTIVRGGKPDFWPIRGAYAGNVWAREGSVSGAGYFAIGMGPMGDADRSAMKWYYTRFLREADAQLGPCDTVSPYPHVAVCAFVNWPADLEARNPAEVLPHCYRDSSAHFYLWRNRWQDNNDTVISVLLTRTRGFVDKMDAKPDRALQLNTMGKHISWGTVKKGAPRHWSHSPRGTTSSLTTCDGTAFAVDFSGASGADVMLVTTGQADGQTVNVDGKKLTFYFPTEKTAPGVRIQGDAAIVGKQQVSFKDGHIVLSATGEGD